VIFYEQISDNNFLSFDGHEFVESQQISDNSINKFDILNIANIMNKECVVDDKSYFNIMKTYHTVGIDKSKFKEYQLIESHIYRKLVEYRLESMWGFYNKNKNSNLFKNTIEYYSNYGQKQYMMLRELETKPIYTTHGESFLKFKDTRTGRLASSEVSDLNIYNMSNDDRKTIISKSGYVIVQFDYVACQMRLYLALSDNKLAECYDPYIKIAKDLNIDRHDAKLYSFKMLFSKYKNKDIKKLNQNCQCYLSDVFCKKLYGDNNVIGSYTYDTYQRPILITSQSDSVITNNILQCTERNALLNSLCAVNDYIKSNNVNARILFSFYDAGILMISEKELLHIKNIRKIFEQSKLCNMYSKISVGHNYGEMKEIKDSRNGA